MDYNRDPRQQLHPTTVADESLPYPSAPCSAVPNNVLSLGGGTVANYLLTATSQQQVTKILLLISYLINVLAFSGYTGIGEVSSRIS